MNTQPISKQELTEDGALNVHHMFSTIQGEGPFAGVPAIFIRLNGCNLQCPLCDTDYTSIGRLLSPRAVLDHVLSVEHVPGHLIVLSGGEPFRQNIAPLVHLLVVEGFRVQIETNGTLDVADVPVWNKRVTIVCSPKTGKIHPNLRPWIQALKYVINADNIDPLDGLPRTALGHRAHPCVARPWPEFAGTVYVQPCDTGDETDNWRHRQAAIESCRRFGYTLCLQLHKIINLE